MNVPDKSWMSLSPFSMEFHDGLTTFTNLAVANTDYEEGHLPCPCSCCTDRDIIPISEMRKQFS